MDKPMRSIYGVHAIKTKSMKLHSILDSILSDVLPETINERVLENDRPRAFEAMQT